MSTRAMSRYYASLGGGGGFGGNAGDGPGLLDLIMGTNKVEGGPTIDAQGNVVPGLYQGKGGWAGRRARELNAPLNETALQGRLTKEQQSELAKQQKELEQERARLEKEKIELEGRIKDHQAKVASHIDYSKSIGAPSYDPTTDKPLAKSEDLAEAASRAHQNEIEGMKMRNIAMRAPGSQEAETEGFQAGLRSPVFKNLEATKMVIPEGGVGTMANYPGSQNAITGVGGSRNLIQYPTKVIRNPKTGAIISQETGAGMEVTPGKINIPKPPIPLDPNVAAQAAAGTNAIPPMNPPASIWDQDYLSGQQTDTVPPLNPNAPFGMPSTLPQFGMPNTLPPLGTPQYTPFPANNIPQDGGNIAPTNMPMSNIQRLIEAQKDPRYATPAWMQRLKQRWYQGNLFGPMP